MLLVCDGIPHVPSHGDYHPGNVFLAPGLTTVVDWDSLAAREPAYDVGYAIGQLLAVSRILLGDFTPGARAALAFWRWYSTEGSASWERVAVHVSRSLLYSLHFELCAVRNERSDLVEPWIDLMEDWLSSRGPAGLERVFAAG